MEILEIPIIRQSIYKTYLDEINHDQVASDLRLYSVPIKQECPEHGWVSRGFVQYEDLVVPVTPEIVRLEKVILSVLEKMTGNEYEIHDMWSVDLIKNQSVIAHSHHSNLHSHPEEYYSIAYYPEVPDGSAELIFSTQWCGIMQGNFAVKPEVGMLVIFNSYITHMTARHKVDAPRRVLSMNLGPKNPSNLPNADWSVYWNRPVIDNPVIV